MSNIKGEAKLHADHGGEGRAPAAAQGEPGTAADDRDLEKSLLREGDDEVGTLCRFIDAEKAAEANPDGYSVALLCRVTGINRSTYYSWLAARPAAVERQCAEDELTAEIREIHASSRGAYGAPRVHAALRRKGHAINRKKVERRLAEEAAAREAAEAEAKKNRGLFRRRT
ncbi:IS3 family transposase [Streptomyces sp. NPDC058316]|uniref:IS3 family transposase n=1 Tax=unclassified Streptomyces TaxID=2593676 RepID=UPI003321C278